MTQASHLSRSGLVEKPKLGRRALLWLLSYDGTTSVERVCRNEECSQPNNRGIRSHNRKDLDLFIICGMDTWDTWLTKVGNYTTESSYCAEDEDVEEERVRAALQTASEVEGFPSFLRGSGRITLLFILAAGRDKNEPTFCSESTTVHVSIPVRPVKDITLTDIHHRHSTFC